MDQNVLISRKPYLEQLVENNLKEVDELHAIQQQKQKQHIQYRKKTT